jgi:hypothetical protein
LTPNSSPVNSLSSTPSVGISSPTPNITIGD